MKIYRTNVSLTPQPSATKTEQEKAHNYCRTYTICTVPQAPELSNAKANKTPPVEERFEEVRQLIHVGKEKGFLLFEEIQELLPAEITSSEDLDELFSAFNTAGIEIVETEEKYKERKRN